MDHHAGYWSIEDGIIDTCMTKYLFIMHLKLLVKPSNFFIYLGKVIIAKPHGWNLYYYNDVSYETFGEDFIYREAYLKPYIS